MFSIICTTVAFLIKLSLNIIRNEAQVSKINVITMSATDSDSMHQELSFDILHLYVGLWEVF